MNEWVPCFVLGSLAVAALLWERDFHQRPKESKRGNLARGRSVREATIKLPDAFGFWLVI
jgi:hypothetical protein